MSLFYNIPSELVDIILSFIFDKRGYRYSHYYKFKLEFRNIINELNKYFLNNYWYQKELNNNVIVPNYLKIQGLRKLRKIKNKYKTLNDLKFAEYCDDFLTYKKYY